MTTTTKSDPLAAPVDGGGGKGGTRPQRLIGVLGAPASGKSTLLQTLLDASIARGRDARVLDPAGNWPDVGEWPEKQDDPREMETIADDWLRGIMRARAPIRDAQGRARPRPGLRPLFLIADDLDSYSDAKARGPWKRLFTTYRHYQLDLAIAARRSQDTPKVVFTSASFLYLFRHHVSTDYLREQYGAELVARIPEEPFQYVLYNTETREMFDGKTKPRAVRTASDGESRGW